jgi:arginase
VVALSVISKGRETLLAVKIVRQPKKIALIGAPTSAAALRGGHEKAPAALRAAGLVERLREAGFEVADLGDALQQVFQSDDEHPRARNVAALVKSLNDLRPRVEAAVKTGALPLIIGGDCSVALATIAGARRYYKQVNLVYIDADADLNIPASTPSGIVDGMVVSHIVGRGAPELVRFWGEPPLVREADVVLFGYHRLDHPEEAALARSPMRRFRAEDVRRMGASAAARSAVQQLHAGKQEFVLHFDVDAISADEFPATNYAGGSLSLNEIREALKVFAAEPNVVAFEITTYNPDLDTNGAYAKTLIDLIVEVFQARAEAAAKAAAAAASASAATPAPESSAAPAPEQSPAAEPSAAPAESPTATESAPATESPRTGEPTAHSTESPSAEPSIERQTPTAAQTIERETPPSESPSHSSVESPTESSADSGSAVENPRDNSGETES